MGQPRGGGGGDSRPPQIPDELTCEEALETVKKWIVHLFHHCSACRARAFADVQTMQKVRAAGLNEEQLMNLVKALDEEAKKASPEKKDTPAEKPEKAEEKKDQPKQAEEPKRRSFFDSVADFLDKPSS